MGMVLILSWIACWSLGVQIIKNGVMRVWGSERSPFYGGKVAFQTYLRGKILLDLKGELFEIAILMDPSFYMT